MLIGAGAVYIFTHWDKVLDWFRDFLPHVANEIHKKVRPKTRYAAAVCAKILDNDMAAIEHHLYVEEAQGWTETITTVKVPVKELPPRIRCKVNTDGESNDITDEMEAELGMSI